MTFVDSIEAVRAKVEADTSYKAYTDFQLAISEPPCWFVSFAGLDMNQHKDQGALMISIMGVAGYADAPDAHLKAAQMADDAFAAFESYSYDVEVKGTTIIDVGEHQLWAFEAVLNYTR